MKEAGFSEDISYWQFVNSRHKLRLTMYLMGEVLRKGLPATAHAGNFLIDKTREISKSF